MSVREQGWRKHQRARFHRRCSATPKTSKSRCVCVCVCVREREKERERESEREKERQCARAHMLPFDLSVALNTILYTCPRANPGVCARAHATPRSFRRLKTIPHTYTDRYTHTRTEIHAWIHTCIAKGGSWVGSAALWNRKPEP